MPAPQMDTDFFLCLSVVFFKGWFGFGINTVQFKKS